MKPESSIPVQPATDEEQVVIDQINNTWTRDQALYELKSHLQTAIDVELATIPVYLYAYYSINRTPPDFPQSPLSRFADRAGAVVMSVAVEEMLHMSLSSNVLFALGVDPQLYLRSPGPFPTNLPGHSKLGPDHEPLEIPLAPLGLEQLWRFLEIEYPAKAHAVPEGEDWETIGQIYSFITCIIRSKWIHDSDFQVRDQANQIQPFNYNPNNIDTAFPIEGFDFKQPVPAADPDSAAQVARFANKGNSHAGPSALITVSTCDQALEAIATICAQGEGFDHTRYDDTAADKEEMERSHYYKFLTLQSELEGYPRADEPLPARPLPPARPPVQVSTEELATIIFDQPLNPVSTDFTPGRRAVADLTSALYQYMLIMSETIFRVPAGEQRLYFNKSMHMSMIWILDKVLQDLRTIPLGSDTPVKVPDGSARLACPFDNINLGTRAEAYGNLCKLTKVVVDTWGGEPWFKGTALAYFLDQIPTLPDVSPYWPAEAVAPAPKAAATDPAPTLAPSPYDGSPKFPKTPPLDGVPGKPPEVGTLPLGASRHACMGLNSCEGQGRTTENACAGQGYCSTALAYNGKDPDMGLVTDHQCHVTNDCAGQGGCGLYGTGDEQDRPGANECRNLGSCATPMNAERFSTDGPNQGKSVWLRAREVFAKETWPKLKAENPALPDAPPPVPGTPAHPDLFCNGPTIEWIQDYSGQGMTACGASGLSGAGSCS